MFGRGRGRAYNDWLDPYSLLFAPDPYGFGGDGINRAGFAAVSQRAYKALDDAKDKFLKHLASVDTSAGPVTTEIINFHLVPDMKKGFKKFVKEHGCTATQRQITRQEQDKINKTRKSLMIFSSVTVTPQAQKDYLAKNPSKAPPAIAAGPVASGSTAKTAPAPAPLETSQSLKRSANAASLGEISGSLSKKKKF